MPSVYDTTASKERIKFDKEEPESPPSRQTTVTNDADTNTSVTSQQGTGNSGGSNTATRTEAGGATEMHNPTIDVYEELLKGAKKPMTAEQQQKLARKRKREAVFSAIGDGISAIANLHYTTKDAPNMFDPQYTLYGKQKERWDKLMEERKKEGDTYNNMRLQLANLKYQDMKDNEARKQAATKAALDAEEREYKRQRDTIADKQKEKELDYKKQKDDDDRAYKRDRDAKTDAYRQEQLKLGWARAAAAKSRGSGSGKKYSLYVPGGETRYYYTKEEMERDAYEVYGKDLDKSYKKSDVVRDQYGLAATTTTTAPDFKRALREAQAKAKKKDVVRDQYGLATTDFERALREAQAKAKKKDKEEKEKSKEEKEKSRTQSLGY